MTRISRLRRSAFAALTAAFFIFGADYQAAAQSQALNGQIEGTVTDANGAAVPSVSITVSNIQTGTERQTTTDDNGFYRLPLLPLGSYRVTAESTNFKKYIREGITLTTGQIATIDVQLETGSVTEIVTVNSDAPIADAGKIDVGRVMNEREVQNLPLVSRNPYNYALLQANVTGRPNAEFGVPRINANGYARRTNYQLDGNNNTQADRSGIRLMPISDTFVQEVQLVTNGFAAEFGNTPGLIMNAVTPQGTNDIKGSVGYRFRRTPFYARPFQYSSPGDIPKTAVDDFTAAIGAPIIKDRWHIYGGYEFVRRDLTSEPGRLVSISTANQAALTAAGVSSSAFAAVIPATQKANFFIVRTDLQINDMHRLTGRFNYFGNNSPDNIGGGLNTLQRSVDFKDKSYSTGLQLASTFSPNILNELRFQYAKRDSRFFANGNSGTGPSIVISGIANFGAPEDDDTISPVEETTQIQNNLTWNRGNHAVKVGGGFNYIYDFRRSAIFSRYVFPSIAAYQQAVSGANRRSYTQYVEAFGNPEIEYKSNFINFFAQDDWKVTRRLKLNFGVRYDLYDIPQAESDAPFENSRNFKVDKNNFAPRLGLVYGLRSGSRPTVVRASAGLYYDTPQIDIYRRAIQNNGNPKYFNFTFSPTTAGAPDFPNNLGSLPTGTALPRQSIDTVDPNFETMYAIHSNVQLEQALTENLSFTVGYIHSNGRHIPVYRNINCLPTGGTLADGRPLYGTATVAANGLVTISACTNRAFSQFQNILQVESVGNSNYDAGTFQLTKRFSNGYQFSFNYTLSHSIDDAPEQNLVAASTLAQSDPSNRRLDRGNSLADQRHSLNVSFVGRPDFNIENRVLRQIVNGNQFGFIVTANNGETYNVVTNTDLNRDGVQGNDRPVGIARNAFRTPKQFNVDMRYSRFINFNERLNLEFFAEFVNVFNINSIYQYNGLTVASNNTQTSLVNPLTGELRGALPNFRAATPPTSLDSRQLQIGFKFNF